jgi:hypothetical protein
LFRRLRTLLEEARGLLQAAAPAGERFFMIEQSIARLEREAKLIAPDFGSGNVQNGPGMG